MLGAYCTDGGRLLTGYAVPLEVFRVSKIVLEKYHTQNLIIGLLTQENQYKMLYKYVNHGK